MRHAHIVVDFHARRIFLGSPLQKGQRFPGPVLPQQPEPRGISRLIRATAGFSPLSQAASNPIISQNSKRIGTYLFIIPAIASCPLCSRQPKGGTTGLALLTTDFVSTSQFEDRPILEVASKPSAT